MKKNKINKAFTLIELLVGISIMSIIILWVSSIDYNRLNNKQKLDIFSNKIKTSYESIRNNALSWKWIWVDLTVPNKWKIDYSTTNSWTISISQSIDKWVNWSNYDNIVFEQGFHISTINCLKYDWTSEDSNISWTWTIEIEWININLLWECTNNSKILELHIEYKADSKIIRINSLNWLVNIN